MGKDKTQDNFTQPWKKLADTWNLFTVGVRPSSKNIKDYESFVLEAIKGQKSPRVLLLGSTPEIRDMLTKYPQIEVTVLDANVEMTLAMTKLMKQKPVNEICIEANWLSASLAHDYYDIIIGDFVKGNIPYLQQDLLFQNMKNFLKPNGCYVERMFCCKTTKPYSYEEVIEKFSKVAVCKESINDLWTELVFMSGHKRICKSDDALDNIKKYIHLPNMQEYYRAVMKLAPRGKHWYVRMPWKESRQPIVKYFKIVERKEDDTTYKDWCNIFKSVPKKRKAN